MRGCDGEVEFSPFPLRLFLVGRSARDSPIEFSSKSNSKLVSPPPPGLFIVGVVEVVVVVVVVIITVVVQLQHSINDPMVVFVAVVL
jgi:hypothetical protein